MYRPLPLKSFIYPSHGCSYSHKHQVYDLLTGETLLRLRCCCDRFRLILCQVGVRLRFNLLPVLALLPVYFLPNVLSGSWTEPASCPRVYFDTVWKASRESPAPTPVRGCYVCSCIVICRWLAQIYSCLSCRLATTLRSSPFSMTAHNCVGFLGDLPPGERRSSPLWSFSIEGVFFPPEMLLKDLLNSAPGESTPTAICPVGGLFFCVPDQGHFSRMRRDIQVHINKGSALQSW